MPTDTDGVMTTSDQEPRKPAKRGRPGKKVEASGEEVAPKPKKRGRPRKNPEETPAEAPVKKTRSVKKADAAAKKADETKKSEASKKSETTKKTTTAKKGEAVKKAEAPKKRGRKKVESASEDAMTQMTLDITNGSAELLPASTQVLLAAPSESAEGNTQEETKPKKRGRKPRKKVEETPSEESASEAPQKHSEVAKAEASHEESSEKPVRSRKEKPAAEDKDVKNYKRRHLTRNSERNISRNNKRKSRTNSVAEIAPSLTEEELSAMKVVELREKARELELDPTGIKKKDLVELIYQAAARSEGFRPCRGILDIQADGYGFIRSDNYMQGKHDAFVFQQTIKQYGLRNGDEIVGSVAPARNSKNYPPLQKIELINGKDPESVKKRPRFKDLTPIYPDEPMVLENGKDSITGRAIDLVAPIGKGQRGLIVSPPKAGKTTILKKICASIAANNPEVHLICLLVDERPEEVTDMQRSIKGEVVASTFDMPAENHTQVAELVIERAKRLVELGEDVVVVLDSITRLARAYNLATPASGRILSGGVDSAALYPPKRFLGAARNIEGGGSLTILASALIDTGSKMDEVIFEEFKGTGNMELKLDRDLADKRIFPAIDPVASGTRNEDLLIDEATRPFVWGFRRLLANMNNTERAANALIKGLKQTGSNQEFLIRSAKKAQQSEFNDAL